MANNRMFLTCKLCKKDIFLAKYYPGVGWYVPDKSILNEDFLLHFDCCLEDQYMTNPVFELTYELP